MNGIIFDLYHTLTGPESGNPIPFTADVLGVDRRRWSNMLTEHSRWRLAGEERDPFTIIRTLAREIDSTLPDDLIRRATESRQQRCHHAVVNIPEENIAALRQLRHRGYKLGLISNADVMEAAGWPDSPLAGLFDAVVFSCEVGLVKPEPAIYTLCLDTLGLKPEDCMFAGDGGSNELIAAKEIGMATVFVSGVMAELWPEKIPERLTSADHHITGLPEMLKLVKNYDPRRSKPH